jgi:conjugal transfer pilus assembly protein TraU
MFIRTVIFIAFFLLLTNYSHSGECPTSSLNIVGSINFGCMLPIRIGGTVSGGSEDGGSSGTGSPFCVCPLESGLRYGLNVQMWEPARLIDTVRDPYCFMPLGTQLNQNAGALSGGSNQHAQAAQYSGQVHFYQFQYFNY